MTTNSVSKEKIEAMIAGLEGVTPGPWSACPGDDYYIGAAAYPNVYSHRCKSDDLGGMLAEIGNRPSDYGEANAAHIARCDPNTMRSILTELLELRSLRSTEGKEGEIEQLQPRYLLSRTTEALEDCSVRAATAEARVAKMIEAITPSGATKSAYIGEFQFTVTATEIDESGEPYECQNTVTVPWTTIKEIMAAISARAALAGSNGE